MGLFKSETEMGFSVRRCFYLVGLMLVLVAVISAIERVDGAGECGRVPADNMAVRMGPCVSASQDANAQVSSSCCAAVQQLGRSPGCLCAVMLSNTARMVGVKPEIAITIPKRCNLADRPVGYKCGGYTLP